MSGLLTLAIMFLLYSFPAKWKDSTFCDHLGVLRLSVGQARMLSDSKSIYVLNENGTYTYESHKGLRSSRNLCQQSRIFVRMVFA